MSIDDVTIGHWTDPVGRTGCTVVLFPEGTVASGEVRGSAPATREMALLDPAASMPRIDAVALSGGSAFGLAAADGVMGWCEERGRGFPVADGAAVVPIVVGMSLFDLTEGDPAARPDAAAGRAACDAAVPWRECAVGTVGAGTGATVGKTAGRQLRSPGGFGLAVHDADGVVVAAAIAVNAFGHVLRPGDEPWAVGALPPEPFSNTTIGVVFTNAVLSKVECLRVARSAHDGFARVLNPAHTGFDGDAVVVAATGDVAVEDFERVRHLASLAVGDAIRAAVPIVPGG